MTTSWGYGFLVGIGADRAVRYAEATATNPSINTTTQADADTARDLAFSLIDQNAIPQPYQVLGNGVRSDAGEQQNYTISAQVVGPSME